MDNHLMTVVEKQLERTVKALNANRFDAHIIRTREDLIKKLKEIIAPEDSCSVGGSVTLFETGVIDLLKKEYPKYIDRYEEGADQDKVFHEALNCKVYVTGTNAVTEDGLLYNVDGRGNRVAALVYGPEKVVVIAGYNKIVPDIEAARERMRQIAAPANAIRLSCGTPCTETGKCIDCKSTRRICSHELTCHYQRVPNRIIVLLMPEELGY